MIMVGFIIVSLSQTVCAKPIKKVGQTGLQFLKADVSPRASAMGGAYTLIGTDATAMFSNPAGMALSEKNLDVYAGQIQWIADINYNALAIMKDVGNFGTIGFSVLSADYGDDIMGTVVSANEAGFEDTGLLQLSAYAAGISYARSLTNKFSIGGQIRYASQHLSENEFLPESEAADTTVRENEVSGLTLDFGTVFYPGFKSFRFGMSIRNFAGDYVYEEENFSLPLTLTIGVAMNVMDLFGDHNSPLTVSIDAVHPRDYTERIHIGAEYVLADMLALRGGYKFNYDEEGLTFGVGFKQSLGGGALRLDYSYSEFGVFGMVNRLAAGFSF